MSDAEDSEADSEAVVEVDVTVELEGVMKLKLDTMDIG